MSTVFLIAYANAFGIMARCKTFKFPSFFSQLTFLLLSKYFLYLPDVSECHPFHSPWMSCVLLGLFLRSEGRRSLPPQPPTTQKPTPQIPTPPRSTQPSPQPPKKPTTPNQPHHFSVPLLPRNVKLFFQFLPEFSPSPFKASTLRTTEVALKFFFDTMCLLPVLCLKALPPPL